MVTENQKAFMSEAETVAEDDSRVTVYQPDRCWNGYTVLSSTLTGINPRTA